MYIADPKALKRVRSFGNSIYQTTAEKWDWVSGWDCNLNFLTVSLNFRDERKVFNEFFQSWSLLASCASRWFGDWLHKPETYIIWLKIFLTFPRKFEWRKPSPSRGIWWKVFDAKVILPCGFSGVFSTCRTFHPIRGVIIAQRFQWFRESFPEIRFLKLDFAEKSMQLISEYQSEAQSKLTNSFVLSCNQET